MKNVVYSAGYPWGDVFDCLGKEHINVSTPEELIDLNSVLVLWGGADINPDFYGHKQSIKTHTGGARDLREWELLHEARNKGIPIIGVCRGAQMLCAAAGGWLFQDVTNHAGAGHAVETNDGEVFGVNTIHHQMMYPYEVKNHVLLAWAVENRSRHYVYDNDKLFSIPEGFKEPEAVWFDNIKGLAVQWHPEGLSQTSPANLKLYDWIEKYVD